MARRLIALRLDTLGHYADGRLTRKISKTGDSDLDFSNRSVIRQARRQQRCREACQISERYDHYNIGSRGFETSRDLTVSYRFVIRDPGAVAVELLIS